MYLTHLSLVNFRNYESLELDLGPATILLQGGNGQGKSNLLEAIYLLAVAKSPRASSDRELVRRQADQGDVYTRVAGVAQRDGDLLRLQIDFKGSPTDGADDDALSPEDISVQKYCRVNGVPRKASGLVGQLNAVMFSADDLELVYGPPSVRRRYLDILISQLDQTYLRALQRFQRVVYQRNHLLKMVKEGRSSPEEMGFWDDELVKEGRYIMFRRYETLDSLSQTAGPIHRSLSGNGEELVAVYRPNVQTGEAPTEESLGEAIRDALASRRARETAQGVTVTGPHRDDAQMLIDGMDVAAYASRGQARTAVLAMKLAEAAYLRDQRGQEPVLLLDDVLSELDEARRAQVLDMVCGYEQTFLTTADAAWIDARFLGRMSRFVVRAGTVTPESATRG